MDAKNERKVFDLIVDITSKSNSAQYFLLTPKVIIIIIFLYIYQQSFNYIIL